MNEDAAVHELRTDVEVLKQTKASQLELEALKSSNKWFVSTAAILVAFVVAGFGVANVYQLFFQLHHLISAAVEQEVTKQVHAEAVQTEISHNLRAIHERAEEAKKHAQEVNDLVSRLERGEIARGTATYYSEPVQVNTNEVNLTLALKPYGPRLSIPCRKGDRVIVIGCPLVADGNPQQPRKVYGTVQLVGGKGKLVANSHASFHGGTFQTPEGPLAIFTSGSAWCIAEADDQAELVFSAAWRTDGTGPVRVGGSLIGWIIGPADLQNRAR